MSDQLYAKLPNGNMAPVNDEGPDRVTFEADLNDIFEMAGSDLEAWLAEMATGDKDALSNITFRIVDTVGPHGLKIEVAGIVAEIQEPTKSQVKMPQFNVTLLRDGVGTNIRAEDVDVFGVEAESASAAVDLVLEANKGKGVFSEAIAVDTDGAEHCFTLYASVEHLQRYHDKYPHMGLYIGISDEGRAQILFIHDGDIVHNPLASSPPWFEVDPMKEYGISQEDAEAIARINGEL